MSLRRLSLGLALVLALAWTPAQAAPQAFAVDVEGLGPVMLFGEDGADAVRRFVDGLVRREAFPEAKEALRAWGKAMAQKAAGAPTVAALRARGLPIVGIQLGKKADLIGDAGAKKSRVYYKRALAQAGATPLFLPPAASQREIGPTLHELDHLVLAGGDDIDPSLYGQRVTHARDTNGKRDRYEQRLVRQALKLGIGVEGICRGCQMLNVAAGGTLTQDLHHDGVTDQPHMTPDKSPVRHAILLDAGSETAKVVGKTRIGSAASWHHQAIADVAPGFKIVGRAPDGVPEVIEGKGGKARCYQFHPERSGRAKFSKALFNDLVGRAKAYARTK